MDLDISKNSTKPDRLPDVGTPYTELASESHNPLKKSILKNTTGIMKGNDRKQANRTKTVITTFQPLKAKRKVDSTDFVCEPLEHIGSHSAIDPVRELREMVQELKSDLDHERDMTQGLEKRVSELEQQKSEPKA
jgi:hypothetical protein